MGENHWAVHPKRSCFPLLAPFFLFFREKKRKNQRKETLTGRRLSKIPWAALSHHSLPVWWGRNGQKTVGQSVPNAPACHCLPRSFFSFGKRKNALSTIARKPGCGTPAGLHASPPIKQEAQAGCSPPLLDYMYFLPLSRKRAPGAVLPAGLHVFPPTQRGPSAGCGTPAGFHSSPFPIRFLFFGSFFSFSERKERTEKRKENGNPRYFASTAQHRRVPRPAG